MGNNVLGVLGTETEVEYIIGEVGSNLVPAGNKGFKFGLVKEEAETVFLLREPLALLRVATTALVPDPDPDPPPPPVVVVVDTALASLRLVCLVLVVGVGVVTVAGEVAVKRWFVGDDDAAPRPFDETPIEVLIPNLPRFMILAGVTGTKGVVAWFTVCC